MTIPTLARVVMHGAHWYFNPNVTLWACLSGVIDAKAAAVRATKETNIRT